MVLAIIPGEFSTFTIAIAILSGFILFFGYVSMFLKERCFLSEACKKKKKEKIKINSSKLNHYSSCGSYCGDHCGPLSIKWIQST